MAEYIDREKLINDGIAKGFCDWYDEIKYAQKVNAISIPEGATNGEMIQITFNCNVIEISKGKVYVEHIFFPFDEEWWNAPYKGVKNTEYIPPVTPKPYEEEKE